MTPVRAIFAGFLAAILFGAGLFVAANFADAKPQDLGPLLALSRQPFELLCFLAAWGALVLGALGVLTAFIGFLIPDDEDPGPHGRRRGFPKAAPIVLIAIALGLAWFAFRCANAPVIAPPVAVPIAPSPIVEATPAADDSPADASAAEPPHPVYNPVPAATASSFSWTFKYPLPRDGAPVWGDSAAPFADNAETHSLLCGKAWIAVTGSASQEGPADLNRERARLRTQKAMARAHDWLVAHRDCGAPPVLGVNLGQHAALGGTEADDDGARTAYQRQILVIARDAVEGGEMLPLSEARAEVAAALADPALMAQMLDGRRFTGPPVIIDP